MRGKQLALFEFEDAESGRNTSTFIDNMKLPVHRWFRYSAGFSAQWVEAAIERTPFAKARTRVLDPFAGSATTLIAAEDAGVASVGLESHPFIARVARAKLQRRSDPDSFRAFAHGVLRNAKKRTGSVEGYPALIRKCYRDESLAALDALRESMLAAQDSSPASELTWLTLVGILRQVSHVGTANWQYVLPKKTKRNATEPFTAFERQMAVMYDDMRASQGLKGQAALLVEGDARSADLLPEASANLVITSPPYPNNYDYADATRLEMCFLGELRGWGELQDKVRKYLVRSCSQHVPERAVSLDVVTAAPELTCIGKELTAVCEELASVRLGKGGKKTYHLMVACYFLDLARVWRALRKMCSSPSRVCFVIGDSAPYGVYVPVPDWLGRLAIDAGFREFRFERIRDRNTKWKNRKHRVPLCEGRLWVEG